MDNNEIKEEDKKEKQIDMRLLYLLPAILALCISITAMIFIIRGKINDLNNVNYSIYIPVNQKEGEEILSSDEIIERINAVLENFEISGFSMWELAEGGHREGGPLVFDRTFVIDITDVDYDSAVNIAEALIEEFDQNNYSIMENVVNFHYVFKNE